MHKKCVFPNFILQVFRVYTIPDDKNYFKVFYKNVRDENNRKKKPKEIEITRIVPHPGT